MEVTQAWCGVRTCQLEIATDDDQSISCDHCRRWFHLACLPTEPTVFTKNLWDQRDPCAVCNVHMNDRRLAVHCDHCAQWAHTKCIGGVKSRDESDDDAEWMCTSCFHQFVNEAAAGRLGDLESKAAAAEDAAVAAEERSAESQHVFGDDKTLALLEEQVGKDAEDALKIVKKALEAAGNGAFIAGSFAVAAAGASERREFGDIDIFFRGAQEENNSLGERTKSDLARATAIFNAVNTIAASLKATAKMEDDATPNWSGLPQSVPPTLARPATSTCN